MSNQRGKFITFEGPEGGGKTTQAKRLLARLTAEGHEVIYTREPGGTPTGEAIREILQYDKAGEPLCNEAEVFLFAASRSQLVRTVIIPALERGSHVICDRFADSTTVYQGYGRGFDIDQMIAINTFAINGATPDLTLLMDVEVATGFDRIATRQRELFQKSDRIEREARAFHERVRRGYLELAARWPARFRTINAAREPGEVEADVWKWVQQLVG
ncbi:MAG TPA: dTMP kinase [Kiritimatiellia bacterium]|nr:dTMP kinase [Kiritimatiellia bacterium]HMP33928.1 dTMP kinase [Kiritimatiellia bacterium]